MKGIVLTLDSIIAFIILVTVISLLVLFRIETTSPFLTAQQLHSVSEDVLTIFSESTVREVVSPDLLNQSVNVTHMLTESDLDKNTIDVIGTLWAAGNISEAANITKDILDNFLPENIGYQFLINNDNIYNSSDNTNRTNHSDATTEISSSRIASGYQKYNKTSGYVARAWSRKYIRNVTKIIPINLEWGGYTKGIAPNYIYWSNGWSPAGERFREAILRKNFTLPTDATIFSAFIQLSLNSQNTRVIINGHLPPTYEGPDGIYERDITSIVKPGLNQIEMAFNNTDSDLAHFHPGTYLKIKYNTSEVESGTNKTVFNADWIRGAPAASENIPFFVNAPIKNVTAFIEVQNINAFLLLTLNYKYNISNPLQNVILYKNLTGVDCSGFSQATCQARPQECSWNPTGLINKTAFHATFDGWSTSSNCGNSATDGWNECQLGEGTLYWRSVSATNPPYNSSSIRYHEGNDIDTNNATWITKCLDLSSYSKTYVTFWYNKTTTTSGSNEKQFILVNRTGAGTFVSLWGSSTAQTPWTYQELNITNYISTYTCIRYMAGAASDPSERLRLDDFKIIGTTIGRCDSIQEDVKNRTYEITFNQTGSLIKEYNSTNLLNTTFNPNVTTRNIYENMTNILGVYADIRTPVNSTINDGSNTNDVDWQRLGMYAHNNTAGHGEDHYCYITENSNVTVYHDIEQYGLEYGKIDITSIENFTDTTVNCTSKNMKSCKDAFLNLTFPFDTRIIIARVLGTQSLAGNDNGYNWAWVWFEGQQNETNLVLDTDTPPGTITYLPVKFFGTNKTTIRVGDKDGEDRALNTQPTTLMGNKRSIVEYKFLIPSQVGYKDVFENQTEAINDAKKRLNDALHGYVITSDIQTESYSVGNVPFMWGPANIRVSVWV